jgi:hypothetical protein
MIKDAAGFFEWDFAGTLFPLKTNLILMTKHGAELGAYVKQILSNTSGAGSKSFMPQTRVHAAKANHHIRRTVQLDPVATYFLYDLLFRNRKAFGKTVSVGRHTFGYHFNKGKPISVHNAYQNFGTAVSTADGLVYGHHISFDIASYFNSIYQHDALHWFSSLDGVTAPDAHAFGMFTRQINSGRSIDFLPQGIYPAKMIGNEFLKFIELSGEIECAETYRFMDDIHLFDNHPRKVHDDFARIQELLGIRALNVNPSKTIVDGSGTSVHEATTEIQAQLASIVQNYEQPAIVNGSGTSDGDYDEEDGQSITDEGLADAQVQQLTSMLADPKTDESDIDTILQLLQNDSDSLTDKLPALIKRYPNIVKQLYKVAKAISAKDVLTNQLIELLSEKSALTEYQLFWIAVIAEDQLSKTKHFGKLILKLYELSGNHKIARAKVLEIPDQSFGLKDIRAEILKSGMSDWPSWAAAAGTRTLPKSDRNHALKYFANGSPINQLVSDCVRKL